MEVAAPLQDPCQDDYHHQSSFCGFFWVGGTQWTKDQTIEHEDWGHTRLPAISLAVTGCLLLGDQDNVYQELWYTVVLHDIF